MSRFLILINPSHSSVLSQAGMKLLVFISCFLFASGSDFSFIRMKSVSWRVTELSGLINKQNFLSAETFIFVIILCCSGLQDGAERRRGSPLLPSERPPALPLLPPEAHPTSPRPRLLFLTLAEGRHLLVRREGDGRRGFFLFYFFNSCCRGLIYSSDILQILQKCSHIIIFI